MTQALAAAIILKQPDELRNWEFSQATFPALDPKAFGRLVDDIRTRGVRVPVDVDPIGRIICGAERTRACKALGLPVPTRVIALAEEWQYQEYAVRDNLHRRHLPPSDQARLLVILEQIEQRRRPGAGAPSGNGDAGAAARQQTVRDAVGERVGLSGRQVSKILRINRLPAEVQRMVDQRKLSINAAEVLATQAKRRPPEQIVALAQDAVERKLTPKQLAKAIRATRARRREPERDVPPLAPAKMSGLLMGLGGIVALEGADPHSVVAACVERAELIELGRLLSRAHAIVVRLRQEIEQALMPRNGAKR